MRHKLSWKCKRWTHNLALIIEIQKKKKIMAALSMETL